MNSAVKIIGQSPQPFGVVPHATDGDVAPITNPSPRANARVTVIEDDTAVIAAAGIANIWSRAPKYDLLYGENFGGAPEVLLFRVFAARFAAGFLGFPIVLFRGGANLVGVGRLVSAFSRQMLAWISGLPGVPSRRQTVLMFNLVGSLVFTIALALFRGAPCFALFAEAIPVRGSPRPMIFTLGRALFFSHGLSTGAIISAPRGEFFVSHVRVHQPRRPVREDGGVRSGGVVGSDAAVPLVRE